MILLRKVVHRFKNNITVHKLALKSYEEQINSIRHIWPLGRSLIIPERRVEKKRSQKRQSIGAATTWFTAPEWIFLSSLVGR